jgi:hypothetical protein
MAVYQRVNLPSYSLGIHSVSSVASGLTDLGPAQRFDQNLDGGGVRGAFGYGLPGTSLRFEFGGSYVGANVSQSNSASSAPFAEVQLLNGVSSTGAVDCSGGFVCTAAGALRTDYHAWSLNGKAETDWNHGPLTLTPSLALFGGNTHAGQSLSQLFNLYDAGTGALLVTTRYTADTRLEWRDVGARAGLRLNSSLGGAISFTWGGWIGVASRRTSLSGTDLAFSNQGNQNDGASALAISDSRAVLLANSEASFTYRVTPAISIRGFGGLNYDGSVPGIRAPSFAGSANAKSSGPAASIAYASQTSLYGGAGLAWKFGGER